MEIIGYVASVIMGLSLGIIGGGGSILTVPILVYFFHQDGVVATTGSLFVVGSIALSGAIISARRGLIAFKTGLLFVIPSFAGVYFSRHFLLPLLPDNIQITESIAITKSIIILVTFAALMIYASRSMIRSGKNKSPSPDTIHPNDGLAVGLKGFVVGCTTGFVGAGGGFLIIPALVVFLHVPMRIAVGTSLAIIAANSLFGFAISLSAHPIEWPTLISIAVLGILGMFAGQYFSGKIDERKLKQGFGYFVMIIGTAILLEQLSHLF